MLGGAPFFLGNCEDFHRASPQSAGWVRLMVFPESSMSHSNSTQIHTRGPLWTLEN